MDAELAQRVGLNIGITPQRKDPVGITPEANAPAPSKAGKKSVKTSPALSMDLPAKDIRGRKVAILVADGVNAKHVAAVKARLESENALFEVIARLPGTVATDGGKQLAVDRPAPNAASVLYDAVFVPRRRQTRQHLPR